jgi:hypothetical protein
MDARPARSTETAMELLVEQVHAVWGCDREHVASILSLDVAGAFDNVTHRRLIHNLKIRRIPQSIVDWVSSFLSDRESCLKFDGKSSPLRKIHAGIHQGPQYRPFFSFSSTQISTRSARGKASLRHKSDSLTTSTFSPTAEAPKPTVTLFERYMKSASSGGAGTAQALRLISMSLSVSAGLPRRLL